MGVSVVKLERKHLEELIDIPANQYLRLYLGDAHLTNMVDGKYSYTITDESGRVLFCGGVMEIWPEKRGEVWALFNPDCRKEFLAIHHAVRRFIKICPVRRIEASVAVNFEPGHRWIKSLGFELEAPRLKAHGPDGRDNALYARVN